MFVIWTVNIIAVVLIDMRNMMPHRPSDSAVPGRRVPRRVFYLCLRLVWLVAWLLLLAGCGRLGGKGLVAVQPTAATVTIHWPATAAANSRVVLPVQSVTIDLTGPNGFMTARVANRPADSSNTVVSITGVPAGMLEFTLHARSQVNGLGDILASATMNDVAAVDTPLTVTAVMEAAVNWIKISAPQFTVTVGKTLRLTGTAMSASDEVVLIPATTPLTWSLTNSSCGHIDPDGLFVGTNPGTAAVPGSGVSGSREISVLPEDGPGTRSALVLYDTEGGYGWYGHLYAVQLENLLKHFSYTCTMKSADEYRAQELNGHGALFYIGSSYLAGSLPDALLDDILATTKPVCWMGMNAWQLEKRATNFDTRFGFSTFTVNSENASTFTVQYKGQALRHDPSYPFIVSPAITNPSQASVLATCAFGTKTVPYVVRSGNFWYFAACPFVMVDFEDKYLAFTDLLHDIIGEDHPTEHKAYIRIEDVAPIADQTQLRKIADTLHELGVPFGICVIPLFRDPMAQFNYGSSVSMADTPSFVETLKYMVDKGGQIIHHGYTHQYGEGPNPINGVSGVDYEFFQMELDPSGKQIGIGPVPDDSYAWALDRVQRGKAMLAAAGLRPVAWNTPHYMASEVDYHAFRQEYYYCVDRGLYFTEITGAQPTRVMLKQTPGFRAVSTGTRFWTQQLMPYALEDRYGLYRVPETLGYVTPHGYGGVPPTLPAELIRRAQAQLVVRDGWAGCYFHWYLDTALLRELVTGIQGQGYMFTRIPE